MSKQTDLINIPDAITVSGSNVGIGTSSSLTNLSVAGTESGILSRVNIDVADSQNRTLTLSEQKITFAAPDTYGTNYNAFINYGLTSLQFGVGNTERMRIDSSGRLLLGTTTEGHGGADNFTVSGSGNTGITIRSTSSGDSGIYFSDGTSGASEYEGYIIYDHSDNAFRYGATGVERMRIDNSGHLMVGTTAQEPAVSNDDSGFSVRPVGTASISRTSGPTLDLNRKSSDGDIAIFRKDGSAVGSIAANGGSIMVGSGNTGLYFDDGSDRLIPVDPASASGRDNAVNLGGGSERFKDLYLSGGVYLGGTGSANKLEDYEEGNHTVTMTPGTSGTVNMNGAANEMSYTKIGRLVTVTGDVRISSVSSPVGHTEMSLPFTVANTTDLAERGGLVMLVWSNNWNHVTATYSDNRNYMIVDITPAAGLEYRFSFSYITS